MELVIFNVESCYSIYRFQKLKHFFLLQTLCCLLCSPSYYFPCLLNYTCSHAVPAREGDKHPKIAFPTHQKLFTVQEECNGVYSWCQNKQCQLFLLPFCYFFPPEVVNYLKVCRFDNMSGKTPEMKIQNSSQHSLLCEFSFKINLTCIFIYKFHQVRELIQ